MRIRSLVWLLAIAFGLVACAGDPSDPLNGDPLDPLPEDPSDPDDGNGGDEPFDLETLLAESFVIAVDAASGTAPDLVRFRMDSAVVQPLVLGASSWIELRPTASITGQIVYQRGHPGSYLTTPSDPDARLVDEGPAAQAWAQFTGDGSAIVFAGGPTPESTEEVWVVASSGGDAERLWTAPSHGHTMAPSLSSDGSRIAVVVEYDGSADTTWSGARVLQLVDVASGAIIETVEDIDIARFSPDGTRVAAVGEGNLYIMNGDGSDFRLLAAGEPGFSARNLGWSPDGEWLLVHDPVAPDAWSGQLTIVDPDTGEQHPTGLNVSQASWAQ